MGGMLASVLVLLDKQVNQARIIPSAIKSIKCQVSITSTELCELASPFSGWLPQWVAWWRP